MRNTNHSIALSTCSSNFKTIFVLPNLYRFFNKNSLSLIMGWRK